jgi:hypothetical protein
MLRNATKLLASLALVTAIAASTSALAQNCSSAPKDCRTLPRGPNLDKCLLWNGKIQADCNKIGNTAKSGAVGNVDSALDADEPAPKKGKK